MSILQLIAQSIGLLAFALSAYGYTHKKDNKFILLMILSSVAWFMHFALLGGLTGALANALSTIRWMAARYTKQLHWRIIILILILLGYFMIGLTQAHHWYDLLPVIGSSITSIGVILFSGIPMRCAAMFSSACWFSYAICMHSIGGALSETIMTSLNIRTIRQLLKAKKDPATIGFE